MRAPEWRDVSAIFISYRREDSGGHAGRLCDRLSARFGDARVFMDLQDIAPGQNFAQAIDETIARCDCVVVVIGPRWLELLQNRPDGAADFVEHEVAAALRRGIPVIPVLVGGARMPPVDRMPPALAALGYRNALEVRDGRFDDDAVRLSECIGALGIAEPSAAAGRRHSRAARVAVPLLAVTALAGALAAYRITLTPNEQTVATAPSAMALHGEWMAQMQKAGQPPFQTQLTFVVTGDSITGMVRYPTGDASIREARLNGNMLTFHTSHVPQFDTAPAVIHYQVEVDGDEMRLTTTDDFGVAKGVARKR